MKVRANAVLVVVVALVVTTLTVPAQAERKGTGYGARIGLSFDPDQFVVGLQADTGKIFKVARVVPSVDLGVGDNLTTVAFNVDVLVRAEFPGSAAAFYGGGGPTVVYWNPEKGDGDLELGLSLVAGLRLPLASKHVYNIEARFGVSDVPDVRVLLGVLFGAGKQ